MARRGFFYITPRQAGMIVDALHGRNRYGKKLRPKPTEATPTKPINPVAVFFGVLIWIFVVAMELSSWKIIPPLIVLDLVIALLIAADNRKRV
jgi:hypothetical protein